MYSFDRCDYCNAQAYVRLSKNAYILDFCGHDFNRFANALSADAWTVEIDERKLLTQRAEKAEVY